MGNIISLVGRPNVGKSSLFNRLTKTRHAIVDPTSGVTRDRIYGSSDWIGYNFSVIDTGGYVIGSDDIFEEEIRKQVKLALDESDVILFLVDGREGLTPMDKDVAQMLRRSGKKVLLTVNKIDSPSNFFDYSEFYSLGLGEPFPVSASNGSGTGELLDELVTHLNKDIPIEEESDIPAFTIIGRPNVGKSSIINAFLGKEQTIVTPEAGTTRDSSKTRYKGFGFEFDLVDTAGLRKKKNVEEDLEFYSVMRSIRAIENSDVCILLIDASIGFEGQDLNIFALAQRNHKGIVIVVNKWDLIEKETNSHLEYEKLIRSKIAPFTDVPIVFTSVTKKQRIYKVLELATQVYNNKKRRIPTSQLNDYMLELIEDFPPPVKKDKMVRIKYVAQLPTRYPTFAFFCNLPQYVTDSYSRFLENKIRSNWDFSGVPIDLFFRKK
ncbi:MAG: ribosome biogenesis GTPase Der [Bacteroidales bacterium]|nr:ribosome biogenesis GTPase Der [Bacteroidales bacterium]MDY0216166.1 ribosome biogenesis GTPase Der [Bacteroidales bacterium]